MLLDFVRSGRIPEPLLSSVSNGLRIRVLDQEAPDRPTAGGSLLESTKAPPVYVYSLENDLALISQLIEIVEGQLQALEFRDQSVRARVCLALREALTNALYHGNLEVSSELRQDDECLFYGLVEQRRRMSPYRDRRIWVMTRCQPDEVAFSVGDEGPGFDTRLMNREPQTENLLRVGGQGLPLIRTFMDEVHHNAKGNIISMTKRGLPAGI